MSLIPGDEHRRAATRRQDGRRPDRTRRHRGGGTHRTPTCGHQGRRSLLVHPGPAPGGPFAGTLADVRVDEVAVLELPHERLVGLAGLFEPVVDPVEPDRRFGLEADDLDDYARLSTYFERLPRVDALRLVRGDDSPPLPRLDTVVLDAPATGHGVALLNAPRLFAETIGHGPISELAHEVADYVAEAETCGVVVVTAAEEMPVQEALELRARLETEFRRPPELLVVNGLYPELPAGLEPEKIAAEPLLELWDERRALNERELGRLERHWPGPRVELPLLAESRGPRLVSELHERLHAAFETLGEVPWT